MSIPVKLNSIYFSSLQPPQLQLSHLSIAGKSNSDSDLIQLKSDSDPIEVRLRTIKTISSNSNQTQTQNPTQGRLRLETISPNSRHISVLYFSVIYILWALWAHILDLLACSSRFKRMCEMLASVPADTHDGHHSHQHHAARDQVCRVGNKGAGRLLQLQAGRRRDHHCRGMLQVSFHDD